jgi:hypothetical protein
MRQFYRHWDLLIEKIDQEQSIDGLEKSKDNILLEGEASNHYHRLVGDTITTYKKTNIVLADRFYAWWFKTETPCELKHEEHETIKLDKGIYKFYIQREYTPLDDIRVID